MTRIFAALAAILTVAIAAQHQAAGQSGPGWIVLLDGKSGTMGDWDRLGEANWRLEDGAVVADQRTSKGLAYLVGKTSYTDLEIHAEFWASEDANAGVFFRCANRQTIGAKVCYEANINDPSKGDGTGAITGFAAPKPPVRAGGRWTTFEISARGPQLAVKMDGQTTAETKDTTYTAGVVALQYGTGVIKWRKVAVRSLP
jgi:Domain of Unknown Function (DUF1080)